MTVSSWISKEDFLSLLKNYSENDVKFGKSLNYRCFRNNCAKEEFLKELFFPDKLTKVLKQTIKDEERFVLYYLYSKKKGRVYVLRFYSKEIRVITIFPIGKKTLKKYYRGKFKKI